MSEMFKHAELKEQLSLEQFQYDIPFTKFGASQTDDVTQQYKKR